MGSTSRVDEISKRPAIEIGMICSVTPSVQSMCMGPSMKNALLLLLCSASVFAMPAKRTPTVVAQPDGTRFSVVAFGDERYNYTETLDGYVVVQGEDRYWYYATLSPEGRYVPTTYQVRGGSISLQKGAGEEIPRHLRESRQVITEKRQAHYVEQVHTIDEQMLFRRIQGLQKPATVVKRVLILCVRFPDIAPTQTAASFQDMVNNDSWKGGIGGMSKYYKDVSYNTVSIQADYKDWITAAHTSSYYAYSNPNFGTRVQELIDQAIDSAEANGTDFSLYDNDGDGSVDGLFIVHAGIGAEEGGQTQYIWSLQSSLSASYQRTYDGKTISRFIILPELYGSNHVDIGVFCHEYGHMLGLPDLYDTNGSTNGASEGVGNWCLMAGGSWGGNGSTPERPAHMSAYCKELLGYTAPTVVLSGQALSIPQAETNAFSYKIWMDENQADEYMLIENRQKTGFDLNLPASGLLMYHVDKNLADIWPGSNSVNVTNTHLGVKVYEADGLEQMASGANRGDAGDPYPGSTSKTSLTSSTTPNSKLWNTNASGVEITGISSSAATMTASAALPTYTGYTQQFYRSYAGWSYGTAGSNTAYGMVKCTPPKTGKLLGLRVFSYANEFTGMTAAAFTTFNGTTLSSQTGNAVAGASAAIDNYVQLTFSPSINVTAGVPIYVRILFQKASGGYALPVDITVPATGNSYYSTNGTTFSNLTIYDIPVRVLFLDNSALPIQLASFTAAAGGSGVTLNWQTVSEINNYGFEVERDTARAQPEFAPLPGSFIPGHGTTLEPHVYAYTDGNVKTGKWAYRLKQIDLDGSIYESDAVLVDLTTTGAESNPALPQVYSLAQNYPNPFNPTTMIRYGLPIRSFVSLKVYNTVGQEIASLVNGEQDAGYHETMFDASRLSSGVYFYRLQAGDFASTKKLMLLK
jgi:M6 family metalloprotease-like protein